MWYLKYFHYIMIYLNLFVALWATILDTYLIRNMLHYMKLSNAYKKSESTFKMTMLMVFLFATLAVNWFLLILGKLSPLCYILYSNDSDFIMKVATNSLTGIKQGILYEFALDEDMFNHRALIYDAMITTSYRIMTCQVVQLSIIWFCYDNEICTGFFAQGILLLKISYVVIMYIEKLVSPLYLQLFRDKIEFLNQHANTI